jgi:imidazolonepropionase-like amidohydrolase
MKRILIAIAVLVMSPRLPAETASVTRYKILLVGNAAGSQTTTVGASGERRFEFEFTDRGRGPKLSTQMQLAKDGTPVLVETRGNDYLKSPVSERFSVENGRASWKNRSEQGEQKLQHGAFYVSLDGVPEEVGLLARALTRAPGGRLALLPEGEARVERVAERTIRAGSKTRRVVLYAVSGLDFSPNLVWLDSDGSYFASASNWLTVVREGWESAIPDLLKAQDESEAAAAKELARKTTRRPAHSLVFQHANLFDSEKAASRAGMTVVVTGDRITSVGADGEVAIPADAEVVDASGKALLPGLWDMHVHVADIDGPLNIAAGVTTVRDMANTIEKLGDLQRQWEEVAAVGPRVIACGFLDGPGPYAGPTKALVDTEDEARKWIARYASLGYPQIKVYSSLRPALLPAIIADAHGRGMRVSGHVPNPMTAEEFVRAGADEIQHINFLFLNFWADTVKDTRTPERFTAVAQNAAALDLDSPRVRAFLDLLKERHTVSDPTVTIFETMFTARPGAVSPSYASVADRLPAQVRRGLLTGGLPVPEGKDQLYRDSYRKLLAMIRRLYDSGIPLVAGTDGFSGFTLQRELENYVEAGIPAPNVLQIATLGAARVMKRDGELGSIAAGKKADLVLIDGDPAERISDVRRVVTVVKNGVVYDPEAIQRALGIRPLRGSRP